MIASQELDRHRFFQPVIGTIGLTLGLPASVWLADETGKTLRIAAAVELPDDYIRQAVLRLDEPCVAADVFANGQTIVVTDFTANDRWKYKAETAAMGLKSAIVAPLRVKKKIVGVLDVYAREARDFSDFEKSLVESFANQIAVVQRRIRDMAVLQKVSRLISSELHSADLFERIMQSVTEVLGCQHVSIFLISKSGDLVQKASSFEGVVRTRLAPGEGLAGYVAQTGRSELVPDATRHPKFIPGLKSDLAERSMLLTPIFSESKVIGVISADMDGLAGFDEHDQVLLEALAGQAAVALHNAEMHEREIALSEVGHALTEGSRLHEDQILELIHNQASKLMDTNNMYVALYHEATDTVRFGLAFVDGKSMDVKNDERWQPRKAGKGRTEEIIRTRKPIFTATKADADAWYAQPEHKDYWAGSGIVFPSWLGVPMMVGEKVLGVIATYHPTRDYVYSRDDLAILQGMANQAAIALDNSHMFYDVNRRLQALVEFGQEITSGIRLSERDVLDLIRSQASKLMDTDNMYIALYHEATDTVRFGLAFVDGKSMDVKNDERWQPRKAGKGRTEEIIRTRKPIFTATKVEAEAWYAQPEHREYVGAIFSSWLGVPMMVSEKVLGVIATYHPTRDYVYSRDDLAILQGIADHAAIALDNARLYEEARSLRDEAVATKQLATLGTAMAALQHRINNTFNIIVPNVIRLRNRIDSKDKTIAEILDIIERNARYTSDIIARVQKPLQEIEVKDVDINAVLNDVVGQAKEQWQADTGRPTVEVTLKLDDAIPLVQAPIGQIAEVFRNLVDNAYHAMKEGGQLQVSSRLNDSTIYVRVQDTGPGIPPSIQQRLFTKPVPSKDPGSGAGLGLWLSRLVLQSIGGDVTIESSAPKGTTMLVQIPAPGTGREVQP